MLAVEIILRTTFGAKASPIAVGVPRFLRPRFSAPTRPTAAAPKGFAPVSAPPPLTSAVAIVWARGIGTPVVLANAMVMIIFTALGSIIGLSIIGLWVGCMALGGVQGVQYLDEARAGARGDLRAVRRHQPAPRQGRRLRLSPASRSSAAPDQHDRAIVAAAGQGRCADSCCPSGEAL